MKKIILLLVFLMIPLISAGEVINIITPDSQDINIFTGNLTDFTNLEDTPSDYTGDGGECVRVNVGETALEFFACPGGGDLSNNTAGVTLNFSQIFSLDWTNITITTSQISDYSADTQKDTNNFYLYNDSTTIYFNETQLNATIDARGAGDNSSWNESHADTLYANIQWDYNQSTATYNMYNSNWVDTYNATYDAFATNVSLNWTSITYDTYNSIWVDTYNASYAAGSNSSWNQSHANTLYAPNTTFGIQQLINNSNLSLKRLNLTDWSNASVIGDNSSWNQSYANTLYPNNLTFDIQQLINDSHLSLSNLNLSDQSNISVTGDNSSWNQSHANTLYAKNTTFSIQQLINNTNLSLKSLNLTDWSNASVTGDNSSWNETHADTLYANIQWDYNQSIATYNMYNSNWVDTYNATYDAFATNVSLNWTSITYDTYNAIWIDTYNATYAANVGNSSWNESHANTLYAKNTTFSISQLINNSHISLSNINITDWGNASGIGDNSSWNQSHADTLYASDNLSADYFIASKGFIGGNFTGQKMTLSHSLLINSTLFSDIDLFRGSTQLGLYADPSEAYIYGDPQLWIYSTGDLYLEAYDGNLIVENTDVNVSGSINFTGLIYGDGSQLTGIPSSDNSSWNESHANSLYADAQWDYNQSTATFTMYNTTWDNRKWVEDKGYSTEGGNSSWNESHANTLYTDIQYNYNQSTATYNMYNANWIDTYNASYALYDYNQSLATFTMYNNTWDNRKWVLDQGYSSDAENTSWNESHANTLYAKNTTFSIQQLINGTFIWLPKLNVSDWTNITITESQISDLSHTTDTNCTDGSCATIFYWANESYLNETTLITSVNNTANIQNLINDSHISLANLNLTDWSNASISGDNSSWNQSHADTLYANIQWDYNQSTATYNMYNANWIDTYNASYASLTSDNSSWNESHADTLYTDIQWNYNQSTATYNMYNTNWINTYNASYALYDYNQSLATFNMHNSTWDNRKWVEEKGYSTTGDNSSWNESHADTLYANIQWDYNQSTATYNMYNANWVDTYNASYALYDYNQSLATFTMYNNTWDNRKWVEDQGYSTEGDNSSWNQSHANTLYANIQWDYNQSTATYNMYNANWIDTYNASYALYDYNQSTATYNMYNSNWVDTYNATYDAKTSFPGWTNVAWQNETNTFTEQINIDDELNVTGNITMKQDQYLCFANATDPCDGWILKNSSGMYIFAGA